MLILFFKIKNYVELKLITSIGDMNHILGYFYFSLHINYVTLM